MKINVLFITMSQKDTSKKGHQEMEWRFSMEDLVESILDYVRSDYTDYAIMINGEWGVGKTHFWNNKIKKKIESMQLNGKRYTTIYMSLYGISNLEDISKKIFIETTQLMDKNLRKFMESTGQTTIPEYAKTGLDMANQIVVLDLLKRLSKEKGLMIIFNTHYPQHALDIADQTLLLSKEGTSLFGNTDEILTEENLSRVFHVPVIQLEKKMNGKTYHSPIAVSKNESI